MLTEETNKKLNTAPANPEAEIANEESAPEETGKGNWREAFRAAFDRARRQQKPAESRQELGRDKSKSLFLLVGVCVALLLLFFGVFSHPKKKIALPGENPRGEASLGRKVTPGQENSDPTKAATPMLSADVRSTDPALAGQLTPEDIDRTSRTGMAPRPTAATATATKPPQDYALSKVDFSDPSVGQGTTTPNPPSIVIGLNRRSEKALAGVRAFDGNQTDAQVELTRGHGGDPGACGGHPAGSATANAGEFGSRRSSRGGR